MYFRHYLPFKKGMALHLPLYPRSMLCGQFIQIWPSGFEDFCIVTMYFALDRLSHLGKFKDLHPSFEQSWIPITKEFVGPSLVETGPAVLEFFLMLINHFRYLLSLGKRHDLLFEQTWIPLAAIMNPLFYILIFTGTATSHKYQNFKQEAHGPHRSPEKTSNQLTHMIIS